MSEFIDLSHHNTIPQSLTAAAAAGIVGLIHKATEGTTFVDSKLKARRFLAEDVEMAFGAYHFIRPGKISDQVQFFFESCLEAADGEVDDWLLALDYEDAGVSLDDAARFLTELQAVSGRSPVLYSGHVLKDKLGGTPDDRFTGYRLWLAQYGASAVLPPGFQSYWGWQYTDQGSVPGINPPTDRNKIWGSVEEFLEGWAGGSGGGEPAPVPPEAVVTIQIDTPPGVTVIVNGKTI